MRVFPKDFEIYFKIKNSLFKENLITFVKSCKGGKIHHFFLSRDIFAVRFKRHKNVTKYDIKIRNDKLHDDVTVI
jgi:hypothetical protein